MMIEPSGQRAAGAARAGWATVFVLTAGLMAALPEARAQGQLRNFPTQPILVLSTGGHNAPVRALAFSAQDGSQLLSAGMDKIVNVWDLRDGRQDLARTIRPPIWRGYRGVIYAMALAPPVEGRTRRLALAGYGVESQRGNIAIFRFPGGNNVATGDIETQLPSGTATDPRGHTNTVMGLAFDPTGRELLASCSLDGTVRLWDLGTRQTLAVLRGHVGPVNVVAFTPDGRRLVSGGNDGVVRIWDVERRVLLAQSAAPAGANLAGAIILALGVSPDGRWAVVGRENGLLERFSVANPAQSVRLNAIVKGPVEALAISHDGRRLATAIVRNQNAVAVRPRVDCDVEVRSMPDGAGTTLIQTASNLVYALAFRPDDRVLAFAGGDAQGVYLKDLADPAKSLAAMESQGSSVWDVGFRADSQAVGYSRVRTDLPGAPAQVEGFDLATRQRATLDRAALRGAIATLEGWTSQPSGPWELGVVNARGVRFPLTLDTEQDRRWWSYSFIPAGPGHGRATVAVGCEGGVAIYVYDAARRGYVRTRFFAAHNGPVYTLAPSPDGKWLATGSSDQTVRLWSLNGCDQVPRLGTTLAPAAGGNAPAVSAVDRLGFAEAMGLQAGDRIVSFYVNGKPVSVNELPARADTAVPGTLLEFQAQRRAGDGQTVVNLQTTKRDVPALTLFPGRDGEWVLWTSEGYYDTSIVGDRRYLGWHRNPADITQPTDYFTADKFERELRQPALLGRLWATGDLAQAEVGRPPAVPDTARLVDGERPPVVRIVEPVHRPDVPLTVQGARLPVRVLASADGRRPIRLLRFLVDSRQGPQFNLNSVPQVDQRAELTVSPGLHRINVVVSNDRDRTRTESFDLISVQPQERRPRLVVRGIGVSRFNGKDSLAIRFADRDVRDVEQFLTRQAKPLASQVDRHDALVDEKAPATAIRELLADLTGQCDKGTLGDGDMVLFMVESHVLTCDQGGFLAGADVGPGLPPVPAVPTAEFTDSLARLADYGCRVILMVDGVHETTPPEWHSRVNDWARQLWKRNVVAFVASSQGPSQRIRFPATTRHGAFAQGILESLDAPARSRLWVASANPLTLRDFQEAIVQRVQDLTSRQQVPACYVPETIPSRMAILSSQPGREPAEAPPAEIRSGD